MAEDHGGLHIAVAEKLLNSSAACASSYRGRRPSVPEALAAGPGQRQRRVRAARDRLQPDPPEQHSHARHGGGMSCLRAC